ncbi:MAG: hypothetical protein HPY71_14295 [Firmicutes bacterium]|nr:hypothetical protein [Bacillota bacterium]
MIMLSLNNAWLVFPVIMFVQAIRPVLERRKVDSSVLPWIAILTSCILVIPAMIWNGAELNWKLFAGAFSEGIPIGILTIILYDLGGKPLKKIFRKLYYGKL